MQVSHFIAAFFAGAFITNFVPHFVHGVSGLPFTTPFARPRGVGKSSPTANVIWGAVNLFIGLYLAVVAHLCIEEKGILVTFFTGFVAMGLFLSLRLAKQHEKKEGE